MEWYNIKDKKPDNNQIVLASINGVYRIAKFDGLTNKLVEVATGEPIFLQDPHLSVYWAEIETPES
ncbi:MAG: hypothetical protein ACXVPN_00620 [Bacteroidia bacterium]